MINLELFSCAGGMALGFRRAGIEFDIGILGGPIMEGNEELAGILIHRDTLEALFRSIEKI